jgi:general secretion pathway protein A
MANMNATDGSLQLGSELIAVPLTAISQLWFGEYLLLWRPQISAVKSFYPGIRDPDVVWIRESLATIQGNTVRSNDTDLFDDSLEEQVRTYQIKRHLNADGLVGQQTQIAINTDLGIDAPRLVRTN